MKLNVYKAINYLVEQYYINPKRLYFDFEGRAIYYNGNIIVDNCECAKKDFLGLDIGDALSFDIDMGVGFIETLEKLYGLYYESNRKYTRVANFVSNNYGTSSDILNMLDSTGAELKRVHLECFLYCVIVNGLYEWEFGDKWFWSSKKYKKLFLYKDWFNKGGNYVSKT